MPEFRVARVRAYALHLSIETQGSGNCRSATAFQPIESQILFTETNINHSNVIGRHILRFESSVNWNRIFNAFSQRCHD